MNKVRYTTVKGNPYERGYYSGKFFKNSLFNRIRQIQPILEDKNIMEQVRKTMTLVKKCFPYYYQEIIGRADGAGVKPQFYEALMCPEILGEETGCSTLVYRKPDGSVILSHNEDDDYTNNNFMITKVILNEGSWFITNDPDKMPFGNGFSWNSHGIFKSINYTHAIKHMIGEVPRYFIQRHITEANSISDFISRCKETQCASGFHATVIDVKTNAAVSVEVCNNKVSTKQIENHYCHANHFVHPEIAKGKIFIDSDSNSLERQTKMEQWLQINKANIDKERITNFLLRDVDLFMNSDAKILTVANITVDTSEKDITIRYFSGETHSFSI